VLDRLVRTARDSGQLVVIAGTTQELSAGFRGFVVDVRRARAGLLLAPRGVVTQLQVALPTPIERPEGQPHTVTESVPSDGPPCETETLTTPSEAAL
jgi:hypothetical protein